MASGSRKEHLNWPVASIRRLCHVVIGRRLLVPDTVDFINWEMFLDWHSMNGSPWAI